MNVFGFKVSILHYVGDCNYHTVKPQAYIRNEGNSCYLLIVCLAMYFVIGYMSTDLSQPYTSANINKSLNRYSIVVYQNNSNHPLMRILQKAALNR